MINLIPNEQVQEILEQRKQKFKLTDGFFVLTSLNHVFKFWSDGDISIFKRRKDTYYGSRQPEIAELYNASYGNNPYIRDPKTRKHLYELFINDPECLFFDIWDEAKQELQIRGLI